MSLRLRLTLAAVLLVGAALTGASVLLVSLLGDAMTDRVCAAARDRAAEIAAGRTPPVATTGEVVRVIGSGGQIIGGVRDRLPVPAPGECQIAELPSLDDDYAFASVSSGGTSYVVGRQLVDVLESTHFVTRVLLVGLPVVLAIVAGTTWYVVGRTLAPVVAIRREADRITAADLARRVPQPHRSDEIARLAATVNRMLDRLERAQAAQRRFVSDASHELRSPIAAIRQHTEVALAHPDRVSLDDLASTVHEENLRIERLVDDLLLLARADESGLKLLQATVDVDDLVFDEARRLSGRVEVDTSGVSAGQVYGDAEALRRVLRNLGDNAAGYARSRVAFGLAERDGQVVLTVADDGPGIPAEDRDRVFERFVRLGAARSRDDGGSGLGLAIVAEIVAAHHGTVRATRSRLGGTQIDIHLPTP